MQQEGKMIQISEQSSISMDSNSLIKKIIVNHQQQGSIICINESNEICLYPDELKIQFQSVTYDCLCLGNDEIVVSCKGMPIRIYGLNREQQKTQEIGSIGTKKKNSQIFLSPIQLAKCKNKQWFIGGGHKFVHSYDLIKLKMEKQYKQFNKKHISSLNINHLANILCVGQFDGTFTLLDIHHGHNINSIKIHMDSITSILNHPNGNNFVTCARKDDLRYLWDIRMLTRFITYYRQPMFTNQRIGCQFNYDGSLLYAGNESAQITVFETLTGKVVKQYNLLGETPNNKGVASICCFQNRIKCAVGSRTYNIKQNVIEQSIQKDKAYLKTLLVREC